MKQHTGLIAGTLSALTLAACCATDNGPLLPAAIAPPPAFTDMPAGVLLSGSAAGLNQGLSRRLPFTLSAYALELSVRGYAGGAFRLELRDRYGNLLRLQTITGDTAFADSARTYHPPAFVTSVFEEFTGDVRLGIREAESVEELPWFEFPRLPGTRWTYRRYHTRPPEPPFENIRVVVLADRRVLSGFRDSTTVGCWELRSSANGFTSPTLCYLYAEDDGVTWILQSIPPSPPLSLPIGWYTRFRFPLRVGMQYPSGRTSISTQNYYGWWWTPGTYTQEAVIEYRGPVSAGGRTYEKTWRVDQLSDEQGTIYCSAWVAPDVGIVRMEVYPYPPQALQTWELVSFEKP